MVEVREGATAMLLDSPHSGTNYPADFAHALVLMRLREAEDTHVEKLFAPWAESGATMVAAQFPRSYVDCNRAADDIDLQLIEAPWPRAINPTRKTALGKGLIWRCMDDGTPIYTRKLPVDEIERRIAQCWQPYWQALTTHAARIRAAHGKLFHINCHSMPSNASVFATDAATAGGPPHPDFVVGDRDGTTCAGEYSLFVADFLRAQGYSVALNDPYKGVEIVRALGLPKENQHSLQLEVNRRLYMDESTRQLHGGFEKTRDHLARLWVALRSEFAI